MLKNSFIASSFVFCLFVTERLLSGNILYDTQIGVLYGEFPLKPPFYPPTAELDAIALLFGLAIHQR